MQIGLLTLLSTPVDSAISQVQSDLTVLLNTRAGENVLPGLESSVLAYGLPPSELVAGRASEVAAAFQRAIERFEPRLTNVVVRATDPSGTRPVLEIEAELTQTSRKLGWRAVVRADQSIDLISFDGDA